MHRLAGLAAAGLVFAATQVSAQVSPFPQVNSGTGVLIQQGTAGSSLNSGTGLGPLRNQERARYSIQQQSCASMTGVSADRCYSELNTAIEADRLKNMAIESGRRRDSK